MTELTPKQRYYQNWKTKDPERYLAQSKKTCQRHKEKYANDPEYRAKQLQKAKDYAEKNKDKRRARRQNSIKEQTTAKAYSRSNEVRRRSRNKALVAKYGITIDEFERMEVNQNGVCAICQTKPEINDRWSSLTHNLRVDHDHTTGKVRALLCLNCNTALGHFRDDVRLLQKAVLYLECHEASPII